MVNLDISDTTNRTKTKLIIIKIGLIMDESIFLILEDAILVFLFLIILTKVENRIIK